MSGEHTSFEGTFCVDRKSYILLWFIQTMGEKEVGEVSTFFSQVNVAAIKLSDKLKVGDRIHIKGYTTDFEQTIDSIQVERKPLKEAKKGDHIGIKVKEKVRPNDKVYVVG